jgi:hypothetical protein
MEGQERHVPPSPRWALTSDVAGLHGGEHWAAVPVLRLHVARQLHELAAPHPELTPAAGHIWDDDAYTHDTMAKCTGTGLSDSPPLTATGNLYTWACSEIARQKQSDAGQPGSRPDMTCPL